MRPLIIPLVLLASLSATGQQTQVLDAERHRSRVVWFGNDRARPVEGDVSIEHGLPQWNPDRELRLKAMKPGDRWRLGSNYWSSFDISLHLVFGRVTIDPGHYYLALEKGRKDGWNLLVLSADAVRRQQLDAYQVEHAPVAHRIPLEMGVNETEVKTLSVAFGRPDPEEAEELTFHLRFGPHHLTAPLRARGLVNGRPVLQEGERTLSRILRFPKKEGDGFAEVVLLGSAPEWNKDRQKALDALQPGNRWRLGTDFWAVLDANTPFLLGERKLKPGEHYLVIQRERKGWSLVLLDQEEIRKDRLAAFQANDTEGGIRVPLEDLGEQKEEAKKLQLRFVEDGGDRFLEVRWGPYALRCAAALR